MGSCARRATVRPSVNSRAAVSLSSLAEPDLTEEVIHQSDGQQVLKAVVSGEVVVAYLPQQGLALAEQVGGAGGNRGAGSREVSQDAQDSRGQDHPRLDRLPGGTTAGSARKEVSALAWSPLEMRMKPVALTAITRWCGGRPLAAGRDVVPQADMFRKCGRAATRTSRVTQNRRSSPLLQASPDPPARTWRPANRRARPPAGPATPAAPDRRARPTASSGPGLKIGSVPVMRLHPVAAAHHTFPTTISRMVCSSANRGSPPRVSTWTRLLSTSKPSVSSTGPGPLGLVLVRGIGADGFCRWQAERACEHCSAGRTAPVR